MLAAPFDIDRLEVTGPAVPVLEGFHRNFVTAAAEYRLAADGTLLYTLSSTDFARNPGTLVWVDRQGRTTPITEKPRSYYPQPSLSPDGWFLAVTVMETIGTFDIWFLDLDRNALSRLTFGGNSYD